MQSMSILLNDKYDRFDQESLPAVLSKTTLRIYLTSGSYVGIEYNRDWYLGVGPYIDDGCQT